MQRAATEVMQAIIFSAVLDGIAALKRASGGLPNQLLRDVQAIHANVTFADLPKELQDSLVEATRSACDCPGGWVMPSPITRPLLTTTAPTIGFGLVCPRARSASSIALRRCRVSCSVTAIDGIVDSRINDTSAFAPPG